MTRQKKVIIIGSGLGGLSSGVVLAKNGYAVTVLEQGVQAGGCLQCFTRRGAKFETGMHFIGSAAHGQTLDRLMRYLEIDRTVRLSQLDPGAMMSCPWAAGGMPLPTAEKPSSGRCRRISLPSTTIS